MLRTGARFRKLAGTAAVGFALLASGRADAGSRLAGEVDAKGLAMVLAREKGNIVLVNFWATWCVPCREEFPDLVRLQRALGPRGLRIIGVTTDFASAMPAVEKFLETQNPGFANFHKKSGGDDQDFIDAVDPKWAGELPYSVLYRRDGTKARTLSGKRTYEEYERQVSVLLLQAASKRPAEGARDAARRNRSLAHPEDGQSPIPDGRGRSPGAALR